MVSQDSENMSRRERRRAQEATSDVLIETTGTSEDGQQESVEGDEPETEEPETDVEARTANRKARRTAAAQARSSRRREQAEAEAVGLDAGEMVDDAFVRLADKTGKGLRKYSSMIQWVVSVGILGWIGTETYQWVGNNADADATQVLYAGTLAEQGRIGDPDEGGKAGPGGISDPRRVFATRADLLKSALAKYEQATTLREGEGSEAFALLGQAGVLFEMGDADKAIPLFERVAASPLAQAQPTLLGSALDGLALSQEAKGDTAGALQTAVRLETVAGFEQPSLYLQARLQNSLGKPDLAKPLLNKLFEKLGPPLAAAVGPLPNPSDFLRLRAEQLTALVDPLQKDITVPTAPLGASAVEQMLRQLREQGQLSSPEKK